MEEQTLGRLWRSVKRLASLPEEQIKYLEDLGAGGSSDELALEFTDDYQFAAAELGGNPKLLAVLRKLDDYLLGMSGENRDELWQYSALYSAAEWTTIRELSREALSHRSARPAETD